MPINVANMTTTSFSTVTPGGISSITVDVPADTRAGDMILLIATNEAPFSLAQATFPDGFTLYPDGFFPPNGLMENTTPTLAWLGWKILDSPAVGTYTVSFSKVSYYGGLTCFVIRNTNINALLFDAIYVEYPITNPLILPDDIDGFPGRTTGTDQCLFTFYTLHKSLVDPSGISLSPELTQRESYIVSDQYPPSVNNNDHVQVLIGSISIPAGTHPTLSGGNAGTSTSSGYSFFSVRESTEASPYSNDEKIWARGAFGYGYARGYA